MDLASATKESSTFTFIKTSKASADPTTIEVNPRNTNFAVDAGAVICYDSMVAKMTQVTRIMMDNHALQNDQTPAISVYKIPYILAWEDNYTPADEGVTTLTIAQILNLTTDATNEDVTPTFNGVNLPVSNNHPLSTVVDADETFAEWNLSVDATMEGIAWSDNINDLYEALQHYTNAGKLKGAIGNIKKYTVTRNRPYVIEVSTKFVPRKVSFGIPYLFYGEAWIMPAAGSVNQLNDTGDVTTGTHLRITKVIKYAEWNPDFNQRRM